MAQARAARPGVTLGVLVAVFATNILDRQLVAVLAEPIKQDLALSDAETGLLYGLGFVLLYTAAGIPLARLADRVKRTRVIGWSLIIFSLATLACGLAASYWQFLLARVAVAIGEGGTSPASHSIISGLFSVRSRTTAMAVFALGPNIGIFLGFLVAGWVAQVWGWRAAFTGAGLAGLVLALLSLPLLDEPAADRRGGRQPPMGQAVRLILASPSMRHLVGGAALFSIAVYSLTGWLPSLLVRTHGFSTGWASTILAIIIGGLAGLGTLASGFVVDRLGARDPVWRTRIVAVALCAAAPLWSLFLLATSPLLALALLVLPGAMLTVHLAPTFAMVQSLVDPSCRATAAAILLFVTNLVGLGIGPLLVGILSDALVTVWGTNSLRVALSIVPPLCLWAAYHYHAAGTSIGAELQAGAVQPS